MDEAILNIIIKAQDAASKAIRGVGDSIAESQGTLEKIGTKANEVGKKLTMGLTLPIVGAGVAAVKFSSDLSEAINATNVTFGGASQVLLDYANKAATSVGLSKRAFLQAATPIGAALQNVGLSNQDAAKWTVNLTQRAADMASVFNTDVNDALGAIQAGLRGEADPLERFGVGLSETATQAYAVRTGLIAQGQEMTAQQKTTARLGLFMEQTSRVQGDFANTSDGLANKQRIAKARLEDTAAALGDKLIPIAQKVVDIVTKVTDKFNSLNPEQQKTVLIVAGVVAAIGPLLIIIGKLALGIKAVAAAFTFLAANPVVLVIMAIILAIAAVAFLIVKNWDTLKQWFATFWAFLVSMWQGIWNTVKGVWDAILNVVTTVINAVWAVIKPFVDLWILQFKIAFAVIEYIFLVIKGLVTVVFQFLWENIIKPYVEMWMAIFRVVWDVVSGVFNSIKNVVSSVFSWIWNNAISPVIGFVKDGFNAVWGVVKSVFDKISGVVGGVASSISNAFSNGFESAKNIAKGAVNWMIDKINTIIRGVNNTAGKLPGVPNIPEIPKLAQGGIVKARPGGILANIAEGGQDEAVIPLNSRGTSDMLNRLVDRPGSNGPTQVVNITNNNKFVRETDPMAFAKQQAFELARP